MNDFRNSVKNVMVVFLILFVSLISYIAYFQAFKATDIAAQQGNKRLWAKRNEILRGTIYDRDMNVLTQGKIDSTLTQTREYVDGDLYVHALGYINQKYGLTGLESAFDTELSTYNSMSTGFRNFIKDMNWDTLKDMFNTRTEVEDKEGNGLVTTLDPALQRIAYDALGDNKGAVVALNPKTGEVLAMVSKPTYDPNNLDSVMEAANSGTDTNNALMNRAVNGLYPPGSTFKTITTASSLQNLSGIENETFEDTGSLALSSSVSLPNVGGVAYGSVDLQTAFVNSSNVVFGSLAIRLGNDSLKQTAESFGFNNNVPAVGFTITKSTFPTLESYEKGEIAYSGIGQGQVLATPMQMALVCSTIANDGVMMEPRLVNQVVDKDRNIVKKYDDKQYGTILSTDEANTITTYMKALADTKSVLNGLNAAGKTGTAENSSGADHAWFIGFAPYDDPQIAVAVIVENAGYGGTAAAPVAASVMSTALNN